LYTCLQVNVEALFHAILKSLTCPSKFPYDHFAPPPLLLRLVKETQVKELVLNEREVVRECMCTTQLVYRISHSHRLTNPIYITVITPKKLHIYGQQL